MPGYDVHFQPVPADEVHGFKVFEFGFKAALKVQGPQALVNRWYKTLMTPKGSDPLAPNYGTGFSDLIGGNITKVTGDLKDAMAVFILDANEQVYEQDLVGLYPDNECLANVMLTDFIQTRAGIEVWAQLTNVAGDALPVRLAILGTR